MLGTCLCSRYLYAPSPELQPRLTKRSQYFCHILCAAFSVSADGSSTALAVVVKYNAFSAGFLVSRCIDVPSAGFCVFDGMRFDLLTSVPASSPYCEDDKACECSGSQPKDFHLWTSRCCVCVRCLDVCVIPSLCVSFCVCHRSDQIPCLVYGDKYLPLPLFPHFLSPCPHSCQSLSLSLSFPLPLSI